MKTVCILHLVFLKWVFKFPLVAFCLKGCSRVHRVQWQNEAQLQHICVFVCAFRQINEATRQWIDFLDQCMLVRTMDLSILCENVDKKRECKYVCAHTKGGTRHKRDDGEVERKKLIKPKDVYANCMKNLFFPKRGDSWFPKMTHSLIKSSALNVERISTTFVHVLLYISFYIRNEYFYLATWAIRDSNIDFYFKC